MTREEYEFTRYTLEYVGAAMDDVTAAIKIGSPASDAFADRLKKVQQELDAIYRGIDQMMDEEDEE